MVTVTVTQKRIKIASLSLALLFLCPQVLRADAWTQPAGQGQLILNFTGTDISHEFGPSGSIQKFSVGGKFQKLELNPYF